MPPFVSQVLSSLRTNGGFVLTWSLVHGGRRLGGSFLFTFSRWERTLLLVGAALLLFNVTVRIAAGLRLPPVHVLKAAESTDSPTPGWSELNEAKSAPGQVAIEGDKSTVSTSSNASNTQDEVVRPSTTGSSQPPLGMVDINQASLEELTQLPGIGPTLAGRIIDHRIQHGPFTSLHQLLDVSGIGPARLSQMADYVWISDSVGAAGADDEKKDPLLP